MAEGGTDPSLADLMDKFGNVEVVEIKRGETEQGNHDVEIQVGVKKSHGDDSIADNSALSSLLNKFVEKLDEGAFAKEKNIDIENAKPDSSKSGDSLEDLMTDLHRGIKSSDWMKHNIEKWNTENTELSKVFMEEISKSPQS